MMRTFPKWAPTRTAAYHNAKALFSLHAGSSPLEEVVFEAPPSDHELADKFRSFYNGEVHVPVILRGAVKDCTALQKWKDLDYLVERVKPERVCDVEVGAYNQGDKLTIRFDQFVDYIRMWKEKYEDDGNNIPDEHLLYLAQNDLPEGLSEDVRIPAICSDSSFGAGKLYSTMLWMGPAGTTTPLHYDPLDNFLMQVVGRKRVFLLPKATDASALYTGEEWDQQPNTSAVDVDNPNYEQFPLFENVKREAFSGVLHPGDMLFIPARWWHAVKSLDFSISVNAWWR
jgi:hypothetical protein